ncbi:PadR family transcriptional regulator [Clostridium saccharoperbutylacetonicum]|uniref:PadR family transcriptional regulator n=1 Tax=Clostridium saccharoperbutylacetonicum TaxID=36745 RepID=UPI000983F3A2|nr:PadR family transcriptional regulator [Clostridium saccharoperbutylacetonicum]AQR95622.1 transcriptional regulator PadR-like family protein [Clostridium saccharoperbutylacetonicum]NSB31483.1 DNA-binding PadR family transcriptional regulator [Clostridium saccharoperbutylacetonicum]
MSLEYAMLGFLQITPLSGYDMKKMFHASVRHFWAADQSQIYRTLARLTNYELIWSETVIQDGRPNSKVYHITEKGKEEFSKWLTSSITPVEPRISWLIQVFFSGGLSDEEFIRMMEGVASKIRCLMKEFERDASKDELIPDNKESKRDLFFHKLTFDYGMTMNKSIINWIEETIERVKNKKYL